MKDSQPRQIRPGCRDGGVSGRDGEEGSLPDTGKAVRCLINYARENPDKSNEIFDEVRCLEC